MRVKGCVRAKEEGYRRRTEHRWFEAIIQEIKVEGRAEEGNGGRGEREEWRRKGCYKGQKRVYGEWGRGS